MVSFLELIRNLRSRLGYVAPMRYVYQAPLRPSYVPSYTTPAKAIIIPAMMEAVQQDTDRVVTPFDRDMVDVPVSRPYGNVSRIWGCMYQGGCAGGGGIITSRYQRYPVGSGARRVGSYKDYL